MDGYAIHPCLCNVTSTYTPGIIRQLVQCIQHLACRGLPLPCVGTSLEEPSGSRQWIARAGDWSGRVASEIFPVSDGDGLDGGWDPVADQDDLV